MYSEDKAALSDFDMIQTESNRGAGCLRQCMAARVLLICTWQMHFRKSTNPSHQLENIVARGAHELVGMCSKLAPVMLIDSASASISYRPACATDMYTLIYVHPAVILSKQGLAVRQGCLH
jgi:hypothetical protein